MTPTITSVAITATWSDGRTVTLSTDRPADLTSWNESHDGFCFPREVAEAMGAAGRLAWTWAADRLMTAESDWLAAERLAWRDGVEREQYDGHRADLVRDAAEHVTARGVALASDDPHTVEAWARKGESLAHEMTRLGLVAEAAQLRRAVCEIRSLEGDR